MRSALRSAVAAFLLFGPGVACRTAPSPPAAPPRSVIVITIDTLRADRLTQDTAPALAAFAASAARFTAARTAVPLTLPSHVTLFTGQLPPAHGVRVNGQTLAADVPTLATSLHAAGYRTAAFVGAYALDRRFGLARGFDVYDDRVARDWQAAERLEAERSATAVVDAASAWLDQAGAGPCLLWVHLYDPHAPYAPPEPYRTTFAGRLYDGEVAYASAETGRLLAKLDALGRLADAVVVIAGDHGEGLGEHGEATHGMLAYDATLRVPLLVRAPGLASSTQAAPVSLVDVAPALLRWSQSGATLPAASGRDLFDGDAAAEVYAETDYPAAAGWHPLRVLAGASRKLIRSSAIEFYDVVSDPAETTDLATRDTAAARAAVARLTSRTPPARVTTAASAEAQARLRSLGYASGPSAAAVAADAANPARVIDAWTAFERASATPPGSAQVSALASLVRGHPGSYVFAAAHGRALAALGRHAEAQRALADAVRRFPGEATLFHDLAVAARAAGDDVEALHAEQAAIALDDGYAAAHHGLGLLQVETGRAGDAVGPFTRAVELDPSNAPYWSDLGNAQRAQGDAGAADRAYGRALQIDGRQADAANGRGVLLVQSGRAADAVEWFQRALAAEPTLVEAQLNLGIAYQQSGQYEEAVATYRELLRMAPRSATRERDAAQKLLSSLR